MNFTSVGLIRGLHVFLSSLFSLSELSGHVSTATLQGSNSALSLNSSYGSEVSLESMENEDGVHHKVTRPLSA
jgi:hypothetical protein